MHGIISRTPALKAAAHGILTELRAIDSDLFGEGRGQRIGSQLYQELFSVEQVPPAESSRTEERKNGTRRQRSSKARGKGTVKNEETGGDCAEDEDVSKGKLRREGREKDLGKSFWISGLGAVLDCLVASYLSFRRSSPRYFRQGADSLRSNGFLQNFSSTILP